MSNTTVPTVRVKGTETDYIVINESDFDPAVHTLYEESKGEEATLTTPPMTPATEAEPAEPAAPAAAPVAPWSQNA